jgi:ribosomal protein S1
MVVVRITDRDVIVDINAKSEGVISLNEFRYNPALKVGDTVEVLIDIREDKTGQLVYLTEKHVLSNHGIELFQTKQEKSLMVL